MSITQYGYLFLNYTKKTKIILLNRYQICVYEFSCIFNFSFNFFGYFLKNQKLFILNPLKVPTRYNLQPETTFDFQVENQSIITVPKEYNRQKKTIYCKINTFNDPWNLKYLV